jgi:hypothetical protein
MTKNRNSLSSLFYGAIVITLGGCNVNKTPLTAAPPPPPNVALTAQERQAIDSLKTMTPAQQQDFMRRNPKLVKNPLATALMREAMMKK